MPTSIVTKAPDTRQGSVGEHAAERWWGSAYRAGEIVCARVEVTVWADPRLGRASGERRCLTARFGERLDPKLRKELIDLVRRRGAAARRAAERMDPVEIVVGDGGLWRQRVIGVVAPPQVRHGDLHEIEFGLWEPAR